MQLVLSNDVDPAPNLCRLTHILGEDGDLLHGKVAEEGDDVVLDLDDESGLVCVRAVHDLNMISSLEVLPHAPRLQIGRAHV